MNNSGEQIPHSAALSLLDLNDWLGRQLAAWDAWNGRQGEDWLHWPTNNPAWPELGVLFIHAFSPLHRYADRVAGVEPADDSGLNTGAWVAIHAWALHCLRRHYEVSASLPADELGRVIRFITRSGGEFEVSVGEALAHACTHCFWHLGGIGHLLRLGGKEPPQRSDLIVWAAERRELAAGPEA